MNGIENIQIAGEQGKPILIDAYWSVDSIHAPLVVFVHGFKGFKDWGHWKKIGETFVNAGFGFVKFNFSHNGTTPKKPTEFGDLEAFGQNNYTKELNDLRRVLDWLYIQSTLPNEIFNLDKIFLIGHSRGGGISILKASEDSRIKGLATWAAVDDLNRGWTEAVAEQWKKEGVTYVVNGRTQQNMPLYYQLYEDFKAHEKAYAIHEKVGKIGASHLILHGDDDPAVPVQAAQNLKKWNPAATLAILQGGDHVFGGRHPFKGDRLPEHSQLLVQYTIDFFKQH